MDACNEVLPKITAPFFKKTEEEKEAIYPTLFDEIMPSYLSAIDAQLAKGGFIISDKITVADFCVGGLYTNYINNKAVGYAPDRFAALLDKFPNFRAYGERFSAEMKDFLAARPALPI